MFGRLIAQVVIVLLASTLSPTSRAETVPELPGVLEVSLSGVSLLLPVTDDLFVSVSDDRKTALHFRSASSKAEAAQFIAGLRGEELRIEGFSYTFVPGSSECAESVWVNRFCQLAREAVDSPYIGRFGFSVARASSPISAVYAEQIARARESGGVFDTPTRRYVLAEGGPESALLMCTAKVNSGQKHVCETVLIVREEISLRFTSFIREQDLGPHEAENLLRYAQEIADGFLNLELQK